MDIKILKIRELIKKEISLKRTTQSEIVRASGVQQATLSRFLNNEEVPNISADFYLRLEKYLNITSQESQRVETCSVTVVAIAGAGHEWDVDNFKHIEKIEIPIVYKQHGLYALRIQGDSMSPTMHDGAYVGMVLFSDKVQDGKIYAVNHAPFGLIVKRVYYSTSREFILRSDNPSYDDLKIPYEGYDNVIVGRVVWVLQAL